MYLHSKMANSISSWLWTALTIWRLTVTFALTENTYCPTACPCLGAFVSCSKQGLVEIPQDLPEWVENLEIRDNAIANIAEGSFKGLSKLQQLDLSSNQLRDNTTSELQKLSSLCELKLNHNYLTEVPFLGELSNLTYLSLSHNEIHSINHTVLRHLHNLKTLDLSHNKLVEIPVGVFPAGTSIQNLNLISNRIISIEKGSLDNLTSLIELKMNRNRLFNFPKDVFRQLKELKTLELNRNQFTEIEGLSFHGLEGLHILKLRRNGIEALRDGAFWGLQNISILQLDHNNITAVTKGWLYGLKSLHHLSLSHNRISIIEQNGWEFCPQLIELDLSNNELQSIEEGTFSNLPNMQKLCLDNNKISYIAEGAFSGTPSLEILELNGNEISWTIEDMNGAFVGLNRLTKFGLASNLIKSINERAFVGLKKLKKLNLSNNSITSAQENAFSGMVELFELHINTSSLLCDCNLKWFPQWLVKSGFMDTVIAKCAHPEWLKGRDVTQVPLMNFTCDDFPKPHITEEPRTQVALKGDNVTLLCKATSTSQVRMTFTWKKDNINMKTSDIRYFELSPDGKGIEEASELQLFNISYSDAGKYQCVVSNNFGTTYSQKANITVHTYPTFTKAPENITLKAGNTARLECAASGHPHPEIAWQKDGGSDFPAAKERRMHVMPTDDVFFIVNVKAVDMGIYSCTASNAAGIVVTNASLTVFETPYFVKPMESKETTAGETAVLECMAAGSPKPKLTWTKDGGTLVTTERHFFTANDQLLIIVDATLSDSGTYECEMSNPLGTERGYAKLNVIPASNSVQNYDSITGIIIITVVCCAVGTSVVWVVIIYQTRKRTADAADFSAANSSESTTGPSATVTNYTATVAMLPTEEYNGSAPQLYLDTNSEHSSGKDSGVGDSAKRSSDDLLPGEALDVQQCLVLGDGITGGSVQSINISNEMPNGGIPCTHMNQADNLEGQITHSGYVNSGTSPVLHTFHPQPTNHERCKKPVMLEVYATHMQNNPIITCVAPSYNDHSQLTASDVTRWSQPPPTSSSTHPEPRLYHTLPRIISQHNCRQNDATSDIQNGSKGHQRLMQNHILCKIKPNRVSSGQEVSDGSSHFQGVSEEVRDLVNSDNCEEDRPESVDELTPCIPQTCVNSKAQ